MERFLDVYCVTRWPILLTGKAFVIPSSSFSFKS